MDQGIPKMEEDTMSSPVKKKYSAEDDYNKIVKYLGKRKKRKKRNKLGQQIDRYWRQRVVQRLVDQGLLDTKIQAKEIKKLLNEVK
jgi:predicted transcriptional regulator YheO